MTVQRLTFSKTYVQDEHQRVQQTLARAIDSGAQQERIFFAGVYAASGQTDTTWRSFLTPYAGNNYFAGWVADKPGSVIAVSVLDTSTANNQQYGVSLNSLNPVNVITRGLMQQVLGTYPRGQLIFKKGDLVALFSRSATTASTSFAATAHITVSVGA